MAGAQRTVVEHEVMQTAVRPVRVEHPEIIDELAHPAPAHEVRRQLRRGEERTPPLARGLGLLLESAPSQELDCGDFIDIAAVPPGVMLTETQLRGLLGMMGLAGEKVYQESGTLSGGEKTKLALAMLMVGRNNLLLLDEPTNNLDPPSRKAVADALTGWKGSIIFVSHDTEFVEELQPTKVLLMPDGQVDYFSPDWLELVDLA
jgi:ABC-type multidrug transport system ATPase subunit